MDNQNHAKEIMAIAKNLRGKVSNIDEMARAAIEREMTVEQFRAEALNKLPEIKPLERPMLYDVPANEWRKYSLSGAIADLAEGRQITGMAREMSDELARQTGRKPEGFWLPGQVMDRSFVAGGITLSSNTLGGVLSQAQNMGSEFIDVLRNRAKVLVMGARVLNLNGPVAIPRQYTEGAANWVAETTAGTLSAFGIQQITLQPHCVTAVQQYSKQLLITSNPTIDNLIRDDLTQILALAIDRAALHGSGSGQPLGIAGTTGINTVAAAANGIAANALGSSLYPFLVSLETEIATDNADVETMGYLMNAKTAAACRTTARFANTDSPILTSSGGKRQVNGYTAQVSEQIATDLTTGTATNICTAVFFGNFADLIVGQFNGGATDLVVDPYSLSLNRVVRLVASRWLDCAVRHPTSFAVGGGLLA